MNTTTERGTSADRPQPSFGDKRGRIEAPAHEFLTWVASITGRVASHEVTVQGFTPRRKPRLQAAAQPDPAADLYPDPLPVPAEQNMTDDLDAQIEAVLREHEESRHAHAMYLGERALQSV